MTGSLGLGKTIIGVNQKPQRKMQKISLQSSIPEKSPRMIAQTNSDGGNPTQETLTPNRP